MTAEQVKEIVLATLVEQQLIPAIRIMSLPDTHYECPVSADIEADWEHWDAYEFVWRKTAYAGANMLLVHVCYRRPIPVKTPESELPDTMEMIDTSGCPPFTHNDWWVYTSRGWEPIPSKAIGSTATRGLAYARPKRVSKPVDKNTELVYVGCCSTVRDHIACFVRVDRAYLPVAQQTKDFMVAYVACDGPLYKEVVR